MFFNFLLYVKRTSDFVYALNELKPFRTYNIDNTL
jgi:hypothetical protein